MEKIGYIVRIDNEYAYLFDDGSPIKSWIRVGAPEIMDRELSLHALSYFEDVGDKQKLLSVWVKYED